MDNSDTSTREAYRQNGAATTGATPELSVIIPTYNAVDSVAACLHAVTNQRTSVPYEVILVDSSTDETADVVGQRFPAVRIVHRESRTYPGVARTIGAQHARGRWIVFTDADCIVDTEWVDRLMTYLHSGYRVVGGSVANGWLGHPIATAEHLVEFSEFVPTRPAGVTRFIPTCNIAMERRLLLEEIGGLTNIIKGSDRVLCEAILDRGVAIQFQPDLRLAHRGRRAWRAFLRNQYQLGWGSAIVRRQYVNLPGAWLTRTLWGVPLLPGARWVRIFSRLLQYGGRDVVTFVLLSPIVVSGLVAYAAGAAAAIARHAERVEVAV